MAIFRYIYGPVASWRMGKSLGIDPISDKAKICNLNCVYCQLGQTSLLSNERRKYVPTRTLANELQKFFEFAARNNPALVADVDYLTFSGRGEPTLALNLGEMIRAIRRIRKEEIAVITNSTLLHLAEVRDDLLMADLIVAKLDACDELSFAGIDRAMPGISFETTLKGIGDLRKAYRGKLAIQIMFIKENRKCAKRIAEMTREINADEIQINTPLRPSAATPLDPEGIKEIKSYFEGMPAVTVYEQDRKETIPLDIRQTIRRHGKLKN